VFNVPLFLAIEANAQLEVGIGRKALFLYTKEKNNGMLLLLMFRGCNRCWYIYRVNGDHNRETNSALGIRQQATGDSDCGCDCGADYNTWSPSALFLQLPSSGLTRACQLFSSAVPHMSPNTETGRKPERSIC
jgi:hypothetical protein